MSSQQKFADKLVEISRNSDEKAFANLSKELMNAFLKFGSETPCNLNCFEHIEYGTVTNWKKRSDPRHHGLKVKGKNIFVADVMNHVESIDMPDYVKEHFPNLTDKEWNAITRIATMVLLSFANYERDRPASATNS